MSRRQNSKFNKLLHVTDIVKLVNNNYEVVSGKSKFTTLNLTPNIRLINISKKGSVLETMNLVYDVILNKRLARCVHYFLVETNHLFDNTKQLHQNYDLIIAGLVNRNKTVNDSGYFVIRYDSLLKKLIYTQYNKTLYRSLFCEVDEIYKNLDRNIYSNHLWEYWKEFNVYQIKKMGYFSDNHECFLKYVMNHRATKNIIKKCRHNRQYVV